MVKYYMHIRGEWIRWTITKIHNQYVARYSERWSLYAACGIRCVHNKVCAMRNTRTQHKREQR